MVLHRFPISNEHHLGEFLTIYHETRKDPRLHHASVRFVHKNTIQLYTKKFTYTFTPGLFRVCLVGGIDLNGMRWSCTM